jgi:histidyl-tRNA synthetase
LAARLEEWKKLLRGVEGMGLSPFVAVDLGVVRGLAYYTGFVFEAFDRKGEFRAIAGGGRYDHLVKKLGGPELPAVGFAMGDVVLGDLLAARGRLPDLVEVPDVFVVAGAGVARDEALRGIAALRFAGVRAEYALRETALGKQFKQAGQSGARLAVIFGEDEVARGVVKVRDLTAGTENDVASDQFIAAVRDHLSGGS